jgi:hypothetical protein
MDRKAVESSQLKSVGYDAEKQICEIEFNGGAIYQYFDVPPEKYEALVIGPEQSPEKHSVGRYFNQNFRGKFKFAKLPPAPEAAKEASTT